MSLNEVLQGQAQSLLPKTTTPTTTTTSKSTTPAIIRVGSTTFSKSSTGKISIISPIVTKTTPEPVSPAPSPVTSSAFDFGLVQTSNKNTTTPTTKQDPIISSAFDFGLVGPSNQNVSPEYTASVEEVRNAQSGTIISSTIPSFEMTKAELQKNIETISQNQINVFASPAYTKFKDPFGNEYTKNQAIAILGKSKTELTQNLSMIESYESKGYQIRTGADGNVEFYKTPEQVREEAIQSKMTDLDKLFRENKLLGVGEAIYSGFTSNEDPLNLRSLSAFFTGGQKGFLRVKAEAQVDLDRAWEEGLLQYGLKIATGPLATIGTAFTLGAGINVAEKGLAAKAAISKLVGETGVKALAVKAAPLIFKGAVIGSGAAMGGMMTMDVYESYKRDPLLGFAKGFLYGTAIVAGMEGYEKMGGTKGISSKIAAAEDKFYETHPERIRMVFMKKGVEAGSVKQSKLSSEWDLEGPVNKDFTNFSKQFQEHPENFKVSLAEQVEKPGQKTTGGLDWGKPEAEIFTSRGGTRAVSRFTLRGSKAYEPSDEWVAMSKSAADKAGPRAKIEYQGIRDTKGSELFAGEKGVNERILYKDLDVTDITGRTGEIKTKGGKRIFDFETKRIEYGEDLFSSERGGGGGITRTKTIPIMETELTSDLGDVFFTAGGLRIGSGAVIKSDVFFTSDKSSWINEIAPGITRYNPLFVFTRGGNDKTGPGFRGELDVDVDTGAGWKGSGSRNRQGYKDVVDQFDDSMFDTNQQQDFTTIQDSTFDTFPELVTETIPGFTQAPIPGFAFKAPGFSLQGFDWESGSLISLFGRTRNYRTGDLEKALKSFDKEFTTKKKSKKGEWSF